MHLVGDPRFPRRNLWGGLILTAIAALLLGFELRTAPGLPPVPGAHPFDLVAAGLAALMLLAGVLQFRLGLRAISPDGGSGRASTV